MSEANTTDQLFEQLPIGGLHVEVQHTGGDRWTVVLNERRGDYWTVQYRLRDVSYGDALEAAVVELGRRAPWF